MTKTALVLGTFFALACAGCAIDPHTGMPVWDDPATSESAFSAVPPHPPSPLVSDYPKTPPLCSLDPKTGKSRTWSSWFGGAVSETEAKFVKAME